MTTETKSPIEALAPAKPVETLIRMIRDQKVMLDADLAELYGVETRALNQAVRRNVERFPETFMFQLTSEEAAAMRSHSVTASKRNVRFQPLAFTEPGVVTLSSVLNSKRAIQMNILVVNAFVRMRELISSNKDLAQRIEKPERGQDRTASVIEILVEDIDRLALDVKHIKALPEPGKRRIGFKLSNGDDVLQ